MTMMGGGISNGNVLHYCLFNAAVDYHANCMDIQLSVQALISKPTT